jgi:chorismate mutase/prephenate dehydratase
MNLEKQRKEIDRLDAQIVRLLNERTTHALEIGRVKKECGGEIYVPAREKMVFDRVDALNEGPLLDKNLNAIYREIMSAAISLEHEVKVAYLGPQATFTHQAAVSKFGGSIEYLPCSTIGDVFAMVECGAVDYGVVPMENSIEGAVTHTFDRFYDTNMKISAEIYLSISLNLLTKVPLKEIKRVYSKQEALGQCRRWLDTNLPGVVQIPVDSTSHAVELVAGETDSAAVASLLAGELYSVPVVTENIEDLTGNTTRFIVLGKKFCGPSGHDKTSILFSVKHKAGALHDALRVFSDAGLNLTKIESRPNKALAWEYNFFVDFVGHAEDPHVTSTLETLAEYCATLKVLGSYPNALEE